jgi:hypothetical protein
MDNTQSYEIGTPGQKWTAEDKAAWLAKQTVARTYQQEVLDKLVPLEQDFDIEQYGALSYDPARFPLFVVKTKYWDDAKPTVLVTGGVHGYETSGVQGAIRFIETEALRYSVEFNIIVVPCVSPWGYETINRWNPNAIDPNRSFVENSPAEEAAALMDCIAKLDVQILAHIDLHETTDTDNSEFRVALAARDAMEHDNWDIPDGFYLVGDTLNPNTEFQTCIINAVSKVTHIAPADDSGRIIGEEITQFGVINYATKALGLCSGFSGCTYGTTTEVYPDSPLVDGENCIQAQVVAVTSGLDYLIKQNTQ